MKQPADDQPAPSVQDDPIMHSAASCPICHRTVEASSELATQIGDHPEAP